VTLASAPLPDEPPFDPDYDTPGPRDDPHGIQAAAAQAELALLGHLLANPTTAAKHLDALDPTDLAQPRHERIWDALVHLTTNGQIPDLPTLVTHLAEQPDGLRHAGGHAYLLDLRDHDPGFPQTEHWAKTIRQAAGRRRLRTQLTGMLQRLDTTTPDNLTHTLAELSDLADNAATNFGPSAQTGPSQWVPLDLDPVLAGGEIDPPPALLARNDGRFLLYDHAVHTISGEPGSGKTWLTLIACIQQLELGHHVTMIDFEDRASRVVGRLLALGAHPDQIRDQFRYVRPHTALDDATLRDLDQAVIGASLVILDGVTEAMTLHGLDLNSNPDAARFHGPAVAMIDHVVKDDEKQGRWGLGAQHKLAGIDGVAYLVKAIETFGRNKIGHARITVGKDRAGHVEEFLLGRTAAELWLDATNINILRAELRAPEAIPLDDAGNMRPTHLMERVCRWLELQPRAGRNQIVDGVTGNKTYIKRAIDRLVQEGYVEVTPGPNNKQEHRVTTPYRQEDDQS
jgi:hypothetical protein